MRFVTKTLALVLFAALMAVTPARAEDAAAKPLKIAVVDIQALLKDSKAAKDIESQLSGIRKNFQAEVDAADEGVLDVLLAQVTSEHFYVVPRCGARVLNQLGVPRRSRRRSNAPCRRLPRRGSGRRTRPWALGCGSGPSAPWRRAPP